LAHDRQIHRFGEFDQLGRVAVGQRMPFAVYTGESQLVLEMMFRPVGDLGFVEVMSCGATRSWSTRDRRFSSSDKASQATSTRSSTRARNWWCPVEAISPPPSSDPIGLLFD
jgi:hypothetical protein